MTPAAGKLALRPFPVVPLVHGVVVMVVVMVVAAARLVAAIPAVVRQLVAARLPAVVLDMVVQVMELVEWLSLVTLAVVLRRCRLLPVASGFRT